MPQWPFGNDPAKVERYKAFWTRAGVSRPLVGFTLRGWFPLEEYAATRGWPVNSYLTPDMVAKYWEIRNTDCPHHYEF